MGLFTDASSGRSCGSLGCCPRCPVPGELSSGPAPQDKHLTRGLKSRQRVKVIKSVSLQIVQMGNLPKEAREVAGKMGFWGAIRSCPCRQLVRGWAGKTTRVSLREHFR